MLQNEDLKKESSTISSSTIIMDNWAFVLREILLWLKQTGARMSICYLCFHIGNKLLHIGNKLPRFFWKKFVFEISHGHHDLFGHDLMVKHHPQELVKDI